MRFIKIDVVKKEVYEVELEDSLHAMVSALDCEYMEHIIQLSNGDVLLADEEGLMRADPPGAFVFKPFHRALAGHGLLIGVSSFGKTIPAKSEVEHIKRLIEFIPVQLLRGIPRGFQMISLTPEDLKYWMEHGTLPDHRMPPNPQ